jgi:uncharacterized protein
MSLANVLAMAAATKNLVLIGDPAQLEQPSKGGHPPGAEVSAMEYLLGGEVVMPPKLGVFLPETRRLHPAICEFTSQVFYDSQLKPIAGLEHQRIEGPAPFDGNGLRVVGVPHEGRTSSSEEEATKIGGLVRKLLDSGARYHDGEKVRTLGEREDGEPDVLIVAPYNAQVNALHELALPRDKVAIGTVDRFQGKEAPIVIYSMTSSSSDEAPRGLEFLYNLNRLNVATSRAQALVVLVMSPALTRARCRTPRQMKMVNALCSYLEMAG